MDHFTHSASPLSCLVNNEAALEAAGRLARETEDGLRFCCESGEKLTVAEGRKRDEADAARKARFHQSMAALEARMLAAETEEAQAAAESADIDDDEDFAEFESDDDADFSEVISSSLALEEEADELHELELV
ncbi:MAG: hypothetical protein AB8C46_15350 [Burkholderiaceae bacterium]